LCKLQEEQTLYFLITDSICVFYMKIVLKIGLVFLHNNVEE